jgi:tetratricopeptide (TPR) repeat protein
MPIGPKHRLGEQRPEVPRQFTDREEFIGVFEQAVSELPPKDYEVLVYYGVGGIGKTSLRIVLCRLVEEKHWPMHLHRPMWAVLDFLTPTHRNMETALFWLRQELNRKYVVQFPSFDLANAIYWRKSRPQTPLRQDLTELEALLEEGTTLANLVSIVEEVPVVSLVPKLSKAISKTDRLVREWWTKRGRRELYDLEEMAPAEIADRLPMYWAADLKDYLERESRPTVLFMDTYEALWEDRRTQGSFFAQDEWVRELVAQLPEVLWVITGRERVRWEESDRDWQNYLHQHLVGGLADGDAQRFLASCGIAGEALQEIIVEGSKGVPFYLDLAVDTYLQIKVGHERDPSPSDFRGTRREVLDRFLRYLGLSETETLKVLSVARFWDRELFKLLIDEFNTGYPSRALPELRRFSFVQEEQIPGTWTIHPLMREALQEQLDAELRGQVHRYLFDHYNDALERLESTAISDEHKVALTEAFHHAKDALATEELSEWFARAVEIFRRAALWQFLIPLYEDFARGIEDRRGPEHPNTAQSLHDLADLYRNQGRYEEAGSLYRRALELREKVLGPEHPDTATTISNLAELYRNQGHYQEAEPLYKRAFEIWEKVLGPEYSNTAISNLAELYREQGRYQEAEALYKRALAIFLSVFGPEHPNVATATHNLALLYYGQGHYQEAEPLLRRGLEIWEKVLGPEHPDIARSINSLAVLYVTQGRYGEAEPLYNRALEIREKVLGPEHPDTATTISNLAELYRNQGHYQEAEPLYNRALEIQEKVLGPEHPNVATTIHNLAVFYYEQGRYEEAEPLYKRALEICEKVLGPEHPKTATIIHALAELYRSQERYEEAEPLYKRALEILHKIFGAKHPDTATVISNLAMLYYDQGRYQEAEPLFQTALAIFVSNFGLEHPYTAGSIHNLADLYRAQGRYEEADRLTR